MTYAGIGSRQTPMSVLQDMIALAEELAGMGWDLRSGGAFGADTAFWEGAELGHGKRMAFLPWGGYNGLSGPETCLLPVDKVDEAMSQAEKVHPAWDRCKPGARKLHARNAGIILGRRLSDPVGAVICWTPGGRIVGGTAVGIRLADAREIAVYNLAESTPAAILNGMRI